MNCDVSFTPESGHWSAGLLSPFRLLVLIKANVGESLALNQHFTWTTQRGPVKTVKLRFIGSHNNFIHPMHVHGGPFEVVAVDGETLAPTARYLADTVNVGPGQRYDVIWTARRPGKWLVHCHIPHHTKNNNVEIKGGGGLTMLIEVE